MAKHVPQIWSLGIRSTVPEISPELNELRRVGVAIQLVEDRSLGTVWLSTPMPPKKVP